MTFGGYQDDTPIEPWSRHTVAEAPFQGVKTNWTFQDRSIIREYSYDAEPYLKEAAESRAQTRGEKWGETRKVGTVPDAVFWDFIAAGLTDKELADMCLLYLKSNPALIHFEKLEKDGASNKEIYLPAGA